MLNKALKILNNKKMKKIILSLSVVIFSLLAIAQNNISIPNVKQINYQPEERVWFARYGQFQLKFDYSVNGASFGLPQVKEQDSLIEKIKVCLDVALENKINVAIFPELSFSFKNNKRNKFLKYMENFSSEHDMIIIAGTFYDKNGVCKNATILPTGTYYTYKTRPSIFESSTLSGEGMVFSDTLHLFNTKYGRFLTLVCVDLISDDANYCVRSLSNKGMIDMLINIEYNPKSQEFMREASAMTVRHPLFVSLTNVSCHGAIEKYTWDGDEYGNTSVFGSVRTCFKEKIAQSLPSFYCVTDSIGKKGAQKAIIQTLPAYKSMLGIIDPGEEALLMYDINLRVIRTPQENNAPDQGYPTIKNIKKIDLKEKFKEQQ